MKRTEYSWLIAAFVALAVMAVEAQAGAIVTIALKSGEKFEAELRDLTEGMLVVRDAQKKQSRELRVTDVKSIDFGETYRSAPADRLPPESRGGVRGEMRKRMTLAEVRRQATEHHFLLLLIAFQAHVNAHDEARVEEMVWELEQEAASSAEAPETRRDLGLARALALRVLGRQEEARALFFKIRTDYPNDPVLQKFEQDMKQARERAEKRGKAPLGESAQ